MQVTASGSTWLDLLGPLVLKGLQVLQGLQGTCRLMIWLHELWLTSKVWPMTFTELHLNYTRCPHMRINSFSNSGENNFASFTHSGTGRGYDGTPGPPGPPGSPGFPGSPGSISVNDIINLLQRKFLLRMFGITHTYTLTYNFCLIICVMSVSFEVCCLDSSIWDYLPKCMNDLCPGEDVRRYVSGPPGPPGPPGDTDHGSYRINTQEVANRVLSLMNGKSYRKTG